MKDVHLNRRCYRILLQAMSRPGRVFRLEKEEREESPFFPFLAIARCLLDQEVSFCVFGEDAMKPAMISATGARAAGLQEADFIFASRGTGRAIMEAKRGTPESPEEGATLISCVNEPGTDGLDRCRVRLVGPGIPGKEGISPEMSGIGPEDLRALQTANAEYPMGVDAVFVRKDGSVMCIPRSCRIQLR
ncbi:MAG: phosphonate C-P lyase system protein PhnH [Desulfobacteraceae bacterium]|jgi:alpha-D-ribose 1-methylphosphonate 5-triphosphate synthase subunit PhnH|nr:MAG: phosphonate C-P lyase system protein PhnH [Desulfobacteraceae bacterium]